MHTQTNVHPSSTILALLASKLDANWTETAARL